MKGENQVNERKVAVIGAGSWGTALAIVLVNNGYKVDIYTRNEANREEMNFKRTNNKYLKEVTLPEGITAYTDIRKVMSEKKYVFVVVPSHAMRETSRLIKQYISDKTILTHATKGLETDSLKRMSEVIKDEIPELPDENLLVLSGPSHAEEVSQKLPTTVVIAGKSLKNAEEIQDILINNYFRVYTNTDLTGIELAGALKNIIAISAGMSDGLGYGDNAKAALVTRGLAEIARIGVELGANPLTFSGLAGVGDLVVTCTSSHSRNWRAGYMLGKGKDLAIVLQDMGMVVEGVKTTKAAYKMSQIYQVEMPITRELYHVLFENKNPKKAVEDLMGRVKTHEMEKSIIF